MPQLVDMLGGPNPHILSESNDFHRQKQTEAALRKIQDQSTNRESTFQASVANGPDYPNQQTSKDCTPVGNMADGRPIIESINSTVIALVGSQITLIARFCCMPRPKKVFWIHRHLALMPSRIIGRYITRELIMVSLLQLIIFELIVFKL